MKVAKIMYLLLLCLSLTSVCTATETKFYKGKDYVICDLDELTTNNCLKVLPNVNTLNKCVVKCGMDSSCIGASVAQLSGERSYNSEGSNTGVTDAVSRSCLLHYKCSIPHNYNNMPCNNGTATMPTIVHRYMSKNCAHGGVWKPAHSKCSCIDGWIGEKCLELPNACPDLTENGYIAGLYRTYFFIGRNNHAAQSLVPVNCAVLPGFSAIFILSNNGNINYNRSWEEYKKGFFVDEHNFWGGLETWYRISQMGYDDIMVAAYPTPDMVYRWYRTFKLNDESQNYSFTYQGITGYNSRGDAENYPNNHFGDCFTSLQNIPFSVPMGSSHNSECASRAGSGWWFPSDCSQVQCNLLGQLPDSWTNSTLDEQKFRIASLHEEYFKKHASVAGVHIYIE